MTLFELFDALELSPVGQFVRDSIWLFPAIEAVHLLGLCLLGGAVLVVDLRLLGFGLTTRRVIDLARDTRPYLLIALAVMFATGVPLFLSEAVKCYFNFSFWVKMGALTAALAFTFTWHQWVTRAEPAHAVALQRLTGAISLGLWFTVAAAGRWIGFS
ncbi:MAG: hypothetical protein HC809_02940 [Gammaproteobacteria bacterium]|nr:hypothetical protein [Gammaproteobacteria bacterium]